MNVEIGEAGLGYMARGVSHVRPAPSFSKRVLDIAVCLIAAPFVLVIGSGIALIIKRDGGSIFYRQPRVGYKGRHFDCFKFRSMIPNADQYLEDFLNQNPAARAEWDNFQKLAVDPRVTGVGKLLRALSLDELPQIFNVLRGEMSIVGPRPIMASQIDLYGDSFHIYCSMLPGITGLWQVSGRASKTFADRIILDCVYSHTWSLWTDIKLMLRTIPAVIGRKGAH